MRGEEVRTCDSAVVLWMCDGIGGVVVLGMCGVWGVWCLGWCGVCGGVGDV